MDYYYELHDGCRRPNQVDNFRKLQQRDNVVKDAALEIVTKMYRLYRINQIDLEQEKDKAKKIEDIK